MARCVVTVRGKTKDCCIVRGLDGYNLDFLLALGKWRYEPARLRGEPVTVAHFDPHRGSAVTPSSRRDAAPSGAGEARDSQGGPEQKHRRAAHSGSARRTWRRRHVLLRRRKDVDHVSR